MHTTKINQTTFLHNGDFSGDVLVVPAAPPKPDEPVPIPFTDLLGLVAAYVRCERTIAVANLSDRASLGLAEKPEQEE